jgi:hypothetical protein
MAFAEGIRSMAQYRRRTAIMVGGGLAMALLLACFQSGCERKGSEADIAEHLAPTHADVVGKPVLKAGK